MVDNNCMKFVKLKKKNKERSAIVSCWRSLILRWNKTKLSWISFIGQPIIKGDVLFIMNKSRNLGMDWYIYHRHLTSLRNMQEHDVIAKYVQTFP